jgi:peptidyl-prolyl cis-trans isomerase C
MKPRSQALLVGLLSLILLSILGGCRKPTDVASVNGDRISSAAFERRVELAQKTIEQQSSVDWNSTTGQEQLKELRQIVLDRMIEEVLIEQAAEEAGLAVDPTLVEQELAQSETEVQQLGYSDLESFLAEQGLTVEEFRAELAREQLRQLVKNQAVPLLNPVSQVHIRHILLLTPEDALQTQARLQQGEDFAVLVEEVSTDRISPGGDLGWLPSHYLPEAMARDTASMSPGDVRIIETEYGYHIVELLGRIDGPLRQEILNNSTLMERLKEESFDKWLAQQLEAAEIEIWIDEE